MESPQSPVKAASPSPTKRKLESADLESPTKKLKGGGEIEEIQVVEVEKTINGSETDVKGEKNGSEKGDLDGPCVSSDGKPVVEVENRTSEAESDEAKKAQESDDEVDGADAEEEQESGATQVKKQESEAAQGDKKEESGADQDDKKEESEADQDDEKQESDATKEKADVEAIASGGETEVTA
ncbi:hypothetical protein Ocin01_00362 [Orchesella cincta]|uniref:Uncharacterized protein n=1 Tax=Orchesella cincta TaxID=48709 RepID=A0A1D2NM46_ORCCI|nr:hypothetical protein Ocin01_00362 [Orchesella cincta]